MDNPITINTCPVRNYKDTLFRMIFGRENEQSARWRMELYNALSGKNHTNPADLELTTIENVIYITAKNDLSFLVDSQMTLYEQQSTVNKNMPLRGLMYFAQLYQMYVSKLKKDLYGELVKIPVPQYVVFYNGDTNTPERYNMKLSEAFDFPDIDESEKAEKITDYEWTADIININTKKIREDLENNDEIYISALNKKCNALYDYIKYVNRIKANQKNKMDIKAAVDEAVNWAITNNLLEGFFAEQKAEVTAMCLTEFDQELYDKNRRREGYEEGVALGKQEGRIEGAHENAVENAKNFLRMKIGTFEQIAQGTGLPLEEVQKLAEEIEKEKQ